MAATLARVVMQMSSGLLEDRVINDFAFDGDANDPVAAESMFDNLEDFYNTSDGAGNSIAELMGVDVLRTADASEIQLYDIQAHLDGTTLGSPVATREWTLGGAPGTGQLPHEVACCLSFRGAYGGVSEIDPEPPTGPAGDIHPRARRRGRVYLGPWGTLVTSSGRPPSILVDCIAAAAFRLEDTSGPGGSGSWCVWSRKNVALYPVTTAWVDNAWDTQRRRGLAPTARTTAF